MKLVSAIITTHNRKELLKRAVESVLEQTYPNIELIVVDDASTDGTKIYCEKYPLLYLYISREESRGGNYARNLGIKMAKGEYVAFLDDDDYWLPTKIEKQVRLIQKADCELVHCGRRLEIVSEDNEIDYQDLLPDLLHYGDMHKKILLAICTTTTCILVKRQALFDIGLFDENLRFWQEYELTIRLAQRKPFYFVNEPLSVYRVDCKDSQRLTNKYFEWKKAVRYIRDKHAGLYGNLNWWERTQVRILIWGDAMNRVKSAGLTEKYIILCLMWFITSLPFRVINKVRRVIAGKRMKNILNL
ncbi:glycosyltransferase family 2 protein [Phocaeicola sartorii]|uniref:glycosyltransferase family 2 protein n=1 Tax=Phocaeicola sartorii TaxID=671267 RepID=UPI001F587E80|nr:glycosyltransferase family 2 protein [Phocaeicola sartorii]